MPRSLSVSRELTVPCQFDGNSTCEFQKPSVKIIMDEKQRETCMFSSFFKREPRRNSTLPIHRISKQSVKINNEDKQQPRCGKVNYIVSFKEKLDI